MARNDEISSTEKLLDLIRSKGENGPPPQSVSAPPTSVPVKKSSVLNSFSFKKKISVGVDIGKDELKLAKVSRVSDKKPELIGCKRIAFDPALPKNSPRFQKILHSALADFCDASEKAEIWSGISSLNVETRYLRIPKVPKKQIPNAVFWTYKRDISFNEQDDIFDYEVLGDILEDGIQKIEVMAYSAPKQEINDLKTTFSRSGYPLTGVSIVPFAIQNLFRTRWIEDEKTVCTLFVGSDWSRIAIFSNGNLVLSRGIKAGIRSMIETLREEIEQGHPAPLGDPAPAEEDAASQDADVADENITDTAKNLLYTLIENQPSVPREAEPLKIDFEKTFNLIIPALDRVNHQVERTIRHFQLNFGEERVQKIYLSGRISSNRTIIDYIGDHLGIPVEAIDPFGPGAPLSTEVRVPESASERLGFVPAIGLAVSNGVITPNFIFTYKDKEKLTLNLQIKRLIFTGLLFLMASCVGFYFWQSHKLDQKRAAIAELEQQMDQYRLVVDQNLIINMVTKAQRNIDNAKAFAQKYRIMALISEISQKTPSNIKLIEVKALLNVSGLLEKENPDQQRGVEIEGIIYGERLTFDTMLSSYLVELKKSPMFGQAVVKKKSYEFSNDKEVMRFVAQLKLP